MRNRQDFGAGLIYLAIAFGTLFLARDYPMGSALKMGPGYFPRFLAFILGFLGLISLGRAFLRYRPPIEGGKISQIIVILGAIIASGFLFRNAGIIIALPVLILISALVSPAFRWRPTILLIITLTLFSVLIFVHGLGVPMPMWGIWFNY